MAFSTPQRNIYTDSEQQNLSTSSSSLSESQIMCYIITVFYAFYNILKSLDFMHGMYLQSNSICTISINRFCKKVRVAAVSILPIFGQSKSLPVDL